MNTKKLATLGVLCATALIIFIVETRLPALGPPGVKLGLANIVTLFTMALLGKRDAGLVLLGRIVMGAMFSGNLSILVFSLTGGICAYIVMALTIGLFPPRLLWVVSVFGAIAHNAGQLCAAGLVITGRPSLVSIVPLFAGYGPWLLISAIVTGAFTGIASSRLVESLRDFVRQQ